MPFFGPDVATFVHSVGITDYRVRAHLSILLWMAEVLWRRLIKLSRASNRRAFGLSRYGRMTFECSSIICASENPMLRDRQRWSLCAMSPMQTFHDSHVNHCVPIQLWEKYLEASFLNRVPCGVTGLNKIIQNTFYSVPNNELPPWPLESTSHRFG